MIHNTPGTYPAKIIAAELGDLSTDGSKPCLRLTYSDSAGNTIEHVLCLFGGATEISLRNLKEALGYQFATSPETLIGKEVKIVTDNKFNAKTAKSFYGVKYLNAPGGKALGKVAPSLIAQLAAKSKSLPDEAPRPPRAAPPKAAPQDDFENEPF